MEEETTNGKNVLKSLAEELKERISKEEKEKKFEKTSSKQDTSKKETEKLDKEIEEISKKITKKEANKEAEEIRKKESSKETLIPLEDYIKCAVHLGTKVITPHMRKFVYKRRADGLSVINTVAIDEKLREAIDFLIKYNPNEIYLVCKREAGWSAALKFSEITGIRTFTKKYPPRFFKN